MEERKTSMILQNRTGPEVFEEDEPREKFTNFFTSKSIVFFLIIITILQHIPDRRLNPLSLVGYFALT